MVGLKSKSGETPIFQNDSSLSNAFYTLADLLHYTPLLEIHQ